MAAHCVYRHGAAEANRHLGRKTNTPPTPDLGAEAEVIYHPRGE